MLDINVDKVVSIIREAGATKIMPHYKQLQSGDIREKNPGDFVTVVDEESERFLSKALTSLLPGSLVVGEESVEKDARVLDRLKENNPVWVIDPLDGTKYFLRGQGGFGILLSLVFNNVTRYGWIYDVEKDRLISAQNGEGVWLDGKRLSFNDNYNAREDLKDMKLGCGQFGRFNITSEGFAHEFKKVDMLGCVVEFASDFLMNKFDVLAHIGTKHTWDFSAAFMAMQEMGTHLRINEGEIYKPNYSGNSLVIAAPNEEVWRKTHKIIHPIVKKTF